MKALNFFFIYVQKILHIRHNIDIDIYQGSVLLPITGDLAKYLLEKDSEFTLLENLMSVWICRLFKC